MAGAALAGNHQASSLQLLRTQAFCALNVLQQVVPAGRGIAQLKALNRGIAEAPLLLQVPPRLLAARTTQVALEPVCRQRQEPVEAVPPFELLPQPLLLGSVQGVHGHLVAARQIQHHVAEAAVLQLHQKLDAAATGTAGEAVVDLLGRRYGQRRRLVVMERTEADVFLALALEHHVLGHHVNDVGPLLDRVNGAGM